MIPMMLTAAVLNWGHLPPAWKLVPDEPVFLINRKRGDDVVACIPHALVESYPSLEDEFRAAVALWAGYLGRQLTIRFEVKDLPMKGAREVLRDAYLKACGPTVDLVIGMVPMQGKAMGETGFKRTTVITTRGAARTTTVDASGRYLFLRDLAKTPVKSDTGAAIRWTTFAATVDRQVSWKDIVRAMETRTLVHYSFDGAMPMMAVLVHEAGHMWGLCDMYDSDQLCDPQHAGRTTLDEGDFVTMGPTGFRQQLYLADDDIFGLRELAKRKGFEAGWQGKDIRGALARTPERISAPDIEIFETIIEKEEKGRIVMLIHAVTNRPARYRAMAKFKNERSWQEMAADRSPKGGKGRLFAPMVRLDMKVGGDVKDLEVKVDLDFEVGGGNYETARSIAPVRKTKP